MTTNSNSSNGAAEVAASIKCHCEHEKWMKNYVCVLVLSRFWLTKQNKTKTRHFLTFICFCSRTLSRRLGRSHARLFHLDQQINTSTNKIPVGQFCIEIFCCVRRFILFYYHSVGCWRARSIRKSKINIKWINNNKSANLRQSSSM